MSNHNTNMGNRNQDNSIVVPTTGGKNNPKHIHVAHRRSQSELTNLMIEQFTLQKQLEMVQAQQQQQLAQQTGQMFANNQLSNTSSPVNPNFLPPHPHYNNNNNSNNNSSGYRSRSHSRNNSGYYDNINSNNNGNNNNNSNGNYGHRKTGSQTSNYGHNRRHSLGLNEAKRAAAEEQAKRVAGGITVRVENVSSPLSNSESNADSETFTQSPSNFKFPPAVPQQQGHRRTNSNNSSSFKFPQAPQAQLNQKENEGDDFIQVPSGHRRSRSKNTEFNSGINSNWRNQSQVQNQSSPFRHKSSNSRDFTYNSFTNLEPPPTFQAGHKHRSSNSSVHSFNSNNNSNTRKSLFAPYLPQSNIPDLIKEGRLVAGILRVNKKNRSDAWVSTEGVLDADIYICGSKDRNRALEGDLVAVELLVVDDVWDSKKEKEEKKRRKDASNQSDLVSLNSTDDYHNDASATANLTAGLSPPSNDDEDSVTGSNDIPDQSPARVGVRRKNSLKQRPTQKKNDDVEVEGQSLLLVEEEEINDDFKPLYAGHVIAVLDRIPGQLFSGTLGLLRPSQQAHNDNNKPQQAPKIVWFKPTDKKVPLIAIPTELAPKDFVENADKYSDKLFVASIKRWPITSLHPFGILVSELGEINDPNTEIDSILRDNNFLSNEYSDPKDPTVERSIFQALPVSQEQIKSRKQFTNIDEYDIAAISEKNGLSQLALHIRKLENGLIELGCHIIDVTAHIEEDSSLDRRARKRSTSVFMPQKAVDLLPQALNTSLTLDSNKESPTISVVYNLDPENYRIKSSWIGESVVRPSSVTSIHEITEKYKQKALTPFMTVLERISTAFHSERLHYSEASLTPCLSLLDSLDDEKVSVDLNILDRSIGAVIIHEIALKVESSVAEKIYTRLGDVAFLRRQAQPIHTKMVSFKKKVQKFGYEVDISSSDALIQSILQIKDDDVRTGVEILLYKAMSRARYFIAGKVDPDQYGHFASSLPLYTHFSAPLRRYADHVVHRQLKAVLNDLPYTEDLDSLKITSEYCNFRKDCSFEAQEQAIHLLLCKTINDMGNATGQLLTMATVLQVYESSFDVFIPEFGIEKRVHGDQLPLIKAEFDPSNRILELHWQPGVDSATFVPADERNPKSYRSSIKNKFRSTTAEISSTEYKKVQNDESLVTDKLALELSKLHLSVPQLRLPELNKQEDTLGSFLEATQTVKKNDAFIQEIYELQKIPVLLRAEIGMALPCLSVRAVNPFLKRE